MNNIKYIFASIRQFQTHNLYLKPLYFHKVPQRWMAGHSKWANIRHIKALKDGQKSSEFAKLAQQMRVAIQEGKSADPNANFQLNQAIELAKRRNMPVEKIQNILKAAQNPKAVEAKPGLLEIRGPGGCFILVSVLTENFNRTKQNLQALVKKSSAIVTTDGAARHVFEHKGILKAAVQGGSQESSLEHAIEAGAEDVVLNEEDNTFKFTCDSRDLHTVHRKLKELGYEIHEAEAVYIPTAFAELNDQQLQIVSVLVDKIQESPEVVGVFENIA